MHIRVHAANWRASCAPPFGLFLRPLAAPPGAPLGGILPQKQQLALLALVPEFGATKRFQRRSAGMHGFVDKAGSVRGAEHRRVRRKLPEGARARCARVGCEHTDVLSDDPVVPEKHRGFCRARCAAKHRVRCLAFLVTFWALRRRSGANSEAGRGAAKGRMPGVMPKSNRLAAGETKLCT
jgi:hypothetical protein